MIGELLKYQETDARLKAIESELSNSDERKKAVVAKRFLESVNDTAAKIDAKAAELALAYKSLADKQNTLIEAIGEYEGIVEDLKSEDEVLYMEKRAQQHAENIKAVTSELKKLEDSIKDMINQYSALKKKTADAKKQYVEFGQRYNTLKKEREEEQSKIEGELKALEKKQNAELFKRYLAKRNDKIFPVLFACTGNRCSSCGMEISISEVTRIKKEKVIECENCRRLIYAEE